MIDLRSDKKTRNVVLFLRLVSIVFFVPLFAGVPLTFRYNSGFDPALLWSLGAESVPWIVTFLLLGLGAFVVAVLHQLLHAATLYLLGASDVVFHLDGLTPRRPAADAYFRRGPIVVYAIAPFILGSLVGFLLLLVVPDRGVAWVFLPTVINAALAASDFVAVAWVFGVPRDALTAVLGDGYVAYAPGPPPQNKNKKRKR